MRVSDFALAALFLASPALAQFVLPAAELTGIPAGDNQKVVLSGWRHCNRSGQCTAGGNQSIFAFAGGGNTYDKQGNFFSRIASAPGEVDLLSVNGTKTTFGKLNDTCDEVSQLEVDVATQMTLGVSFNLVAGTLEITTSNNLAHYGPGNPGDIVTCSNYALGIFVESDETDAYITVTGSKL